MPQYPTILQNTTRRCTAPLAGPGNQSAAITTNDYLARHLIVLPVTPSRYRIRIKNFGTRDQLAGVGVYNVTAYLGNPAQPAASPFRFDGVLSAAPTLVMATTAMSGSTEIVSPWLTTPAITALKPAVLSIGYAYVSGTPTTVYGDPIGALGRVGAGVAANVATTTFAGASLQNVYFDARIEYEYDTRLKPDGTPETPLGLFIGDSISVGQAADVSQIAGLLSAHQAWPVAASLTNRRYVAMNAAIGGTRVSNGAGTGWSDSTNFADWLARVDVTTTPPDFAVIALGINDVAAGVAEATILSNYGTLITAVRNLGINNIWVATCTPGGYGIPLAVTGNTTNTSPDITNIAPSTAGLTPNIDISGAGIPANATIDAIIDDTTLRLSANATATAAGVAIAAGYNGAGSPHVTTAANEALRQRINRWLRTRPYNVNGVIDMDKALALPARPALADARAIRYYPHPEIEGYGMMAAAVQL